MSKDHADFIFFSEDGRIPQHVFDGLCMASRQWHGKNCVVTIKPQRKARSLNLNAFYWGFIVTPVMDALRDFGNNFDAEDTHEFLKAEVGKLSQIVVMPKTGEVKRSPGSTKKMTGSEMVLYIEKIRAWAAEELNLQLKFPNERPEPPDRKD